MPTATRRLRLWEGEDKDGDQTGLRMPDNQPRTTQATHDHAQPQWRAPYREKSTDASRTPRQNCANMSWDETHKWYESANYCSR